MNTKLATAQIRLQNWMVTIRDRQNSGLSVKDYCQQNHISKDAYSYWLRKIKAAALEESGFVEINQPDYSPAALTVPPSPAETMSLQIRELQITLPLSVPREVLSMVIEVVSHAQLNIPERFPSPVRY